MKQIFLLLFTVGFLISCDKENIISEVDSTTEKSEFALRDINNEIIESLPSDLLATIHEDLIAYERYADAERLFELYDKETGILRGAEIDISERWNLYQSEAKANLTNHRISNSYEPNGVFAYTHVEIYGDIGPFKQAEHLADVPFPYAGTVGEFKRLEGILFQTSSNLVSTRPTLTYQLANRGGTSNILSGSWGVFVGTRGKRQTFENFRMWTDTPGYAIYYKTHSASIGWRQPWKRNAEWAGEEYRRLEAIAYHIIKF